MPGDIAIRVRIEGRVQGVWYRNWTVKLASERNLSGWVRNRADGTGEALFHGQEVSVREMIELCWKGPSAARVTAVGEFPTEHPVEPGFIQRPTA